MNIVSIALAAVCISVIVLSLRQIKPEIAQLVSIGAAVLLFACVLPYITEAIQQMKQFSHISSMGGRFIEPIIKITGIAYITNLGAELCSDAGETALAGRVEMAGKILICVLTIPIAREAFMKITGILQ